MDNIFIEDLKIFAYHGVLDFEKKQGQEFYIDARLFVDMQRAGMLDDLECSVNYASVCELIERQVTLKSYDLIEKVAEEVAVAILDNFQPISKVDITVKKPSAPVDMDFGNISVNITRARHTAFVAYGSNLGDSEAIIRDGLLAIKDDPYIQLVGDSGIFRSTPYGVTDQPDFLNGVVEIRTYYEPYMLLDKLHQIEALAGRERKVHWGPRTLDLDIVLYDDEIINTRALTVPHRDMCKRDFVLVPLAKLAGYYMHPILHKTIEELVSELKEIHIK